MSAHNFERRLTSSVPSHRQLRVGELVRHKLSEMLIRGEMHDVSLTSNIITIAQVSMSSDLRVATVYVVKLGGGDMNHIIKALNTNRKFIRSEVARAVSLKFAPDIRFRTDDTFDEMVRINALLNSSKVRQDIE
ncbi:MAG: 30S ribosome-binding factor RbfA [Hyphomicrobiaceae bacterium]|nr:30S ribosome-binding factor RbfA [Hyphomicrobiaceae bacterium]